MNVENIQKNIEGIEVYWVCECDAVAAKSFDEVIDWYKSYMGLDDEDLVWEGEPVIVVSRY